MDDWKPSIPPFDFLAYVEEDRHVDSTDLDTLLFTAARDHGE